MRHLQAAALTRGRAAWNSNQVHQVGAVPASPSTPYYVVSVGSGGGDTYTLDETEPGTRPYRVAVVAVGKTAAEVGFAVEKADAAFVGHRLTPECTPARAEVSTPVIRDPDGGALLVCTLTYTTTEEQ